MFEALKENPGWRRDPNDEKVMALKEQLQQNNCMDDLVTFSVLDPDAFSHPKDDRTWFLLLSL